MIKMYIHSGSGNHGCEAIVRATKKMLDCPMELYSSNPEDDMKYHIDNVVILKDDTQPKLKKKSFFYIKAAIVHKFTGNDYYFYIDKHRKFLTKVKKNDICLSIGGDNYCYAGREILSAVNKELHKKGVKTVLWGCSIDEEALSNPAIIEDLKRYNLITVRETLSQKLLTNVGIISNVRLVADPAFLLEKTEVTLPDHFLEKNTVGINLSSTVMHRETKAGITRKNYEKLIKFILEESDMNIALIPHVIWPDVDDRKELQILYEKYRYSGRVSMIEDCNCMELKGIISKCRFFVGARTHATIAAYSTIVPTLVVGYSIKAMGIAKDLFGETENYVLPVQELKSDNRLTNAFQWIMEHEKEIKAHLKDVIPEVKNKSESAKGFLMELINE